MKRCTPPSDRDDLVAGAEVQMIGVRENHLAADRLELQRIEGLHGRERTHGHERGRVDAAHAAS